MFKQISMTNFKSWRETGPVRMAPLTAFFGANSSGKSSLLQMLLLLKQTAESNDRNLVLKTGSLQEGYVNLGTANDITFGDSPTMRLNIAWELPKEATLSIPIPRSDASVSIGVLDFETIIHAAAQRVFVEKLAYSSSEDMRVVLSRQPNNHYTFRLEIDGNPPIRAQGRPRVYMKPVKCYGFSDEAIRFYQDTSYLSDLAAKLEHKLKDDLYYLGPLREYPQREYRWGGERPTDVGLKGELAVAAFLSGRGQKVRQAERKKRTNRLDTKIAQCLVDLKLASAFAVEPVAQGSTLYQVKLKRHERSHEVSITDMGIGVSQVLPVLILCHYVPEGSTIILEQPELHLHPAVQAGLADVFIDVIKNRNVQILLESHSEHLLRRLQRRVADESFAADHAALYFCEMRDGESQMTELEIDMFGNIRNWPDDFFGDLLGEVVAAFDAGLDRKQLQANGA